MHVTDQFVVNHVILKRGQTWHMGAAGLDQIGKHAAIYCTSANFAVYFSLMTSNVVVLAS